MEGEAPGPEHIYPWSPWRKPGWSRYPHCSPRRKCWIFLERTTAHGELLVEKIVFVKDVGPWEAPTLELGTRVRRKECQKGTIMTTAMTPACYHTASHCGSGEEGRGAVWNEEVRLSLGKKKEGGGRDAFLIFLFAYHSLKLLKLAIT